MCNRNNNRNNNNNNNNDFDPASIFSFENDDD